MVAKMKKFTFLAYHKDYKLFLDELRDLGLIHVAETEKTAEESDMLYGFVMQAKQLQEARKRLQGIITKSGETVEFNEANAELGKTIPARIEEIQDEQDKLNQQLQLSIKERESLKPWGNFDPADIRLLEENGYFLNFFIVPDSQFNPDWEKDYDAVVIGRETSRTYFVTVTHDGKVAQEINLEAEKMPEVSLSQLNELIVSLQEDIKTQDDKLKSLTVELPSVEAALLEVEHDIKYTKVLLSTTSLADDKIMLLRGWAPSDNEADITKYLKSKDVYYEVEDPAPEDDVPIKFKNNKFASFFEPLTELYMLPKYNEIDLTPYFAPFYMLFFGLSLGDIGYGLFLLVVATLAKMFSKDKFSNYMKAVVSLVQVLGASTMVAGLLTGGFFGFQIYDWNVGFIQRMKDAVQLDNNDMFLLSLKLGVVQILFGMVMKVFNKTKQLGFKYSLSTIGWLVFLISIIVSMLMPSVLPLFGTIHLILLIPAVLLIFFYNSPDKNLFVNMGLALWDTYNMATGLLGDVLSYVRLFALGLSGGILASVFNSLASGMSPDNAIGKPIVYVLIFVIGHAINIFMNTLGAIVHPVRLTFVEFYQNADFEGGGKKYNPFSK